MITNIESITKSFTKSIEGYHLVNSEPIKESVWENINTLILIQELV